MIFFVGDKPSSKNVDPNVAFVGTTSYKKLLEWIYELEVDINDTVLCNRDQFKTYGYIEDCYVETANTYCDVESEDKIIALGKAATKHLKELNVNFFELPHPSGLNRKLNDKTEMKKLMKKCKDYLSENS